MSEHATVSVPGEYLHHTASGDAWHRLGIHRRAGILVPLFSVYSRKSTGIGDLRDMRLLVDWAKLTGNSLIQLLPMNEVGSTFCPYDALSSFALDPMYICIDELPSLKNNSIESKIKKIKQRFPAGKPHVDYKIKQEKIRVLREVYALEKTKDEERLAAFKVENAYWLQDFSLYKALKEYHQGKPWYEWSLEFKNRDVAALARFQKEHLDEINFEMWMQWILKEQFEAVKAYAHTKNIFLKGDLPILVSRDSADVWQHPEFFKLDFAAGAPPDMYCAKGQRWGMPTYEWAKIAEGGFQYVKEKLQYTQNFYDILRIDHVVGLFRIWSIPYNDPQENMGLHGVFDPKDEHRWGEHGRTILSAMLKSTSMLLCAEDLGIIPRVCTDALKEFGIPGNEVQRWVKDWGARHDFLKGHEYRDVSVAMLSTHDTTNWPAWWENEAGTVDEALFIRKCNDRKIDFNAVKRKLFDVKLSRHGRLRWLDAVDSADKLVALLNEGLSPSESLASGLKGTVPISIPKEHLGDFIDLYLNSYHEKQKLWQHLGLLGSMREKSDAKIVEAVFKITLNSNAIFCINTLVDMLYLADIFRGDPYEKRINVPGTVSEANWSLTIPLPLEDLLKHRVNKDISKLIESSGRTQRT